ncbi:MAG: GEVED domain-containing protein [Pirellulaceae bacterium]
MALRITSGETVTIDGNVFVFTDGSTPVVAPQVPVNYNAAMNAEQVADALRQAILAFVPVPATISGLAFVNESNDILNNAESSGITGNSVRVSGTGQIGDNASLADPGLDVDLVRIDVDRGATVTVQTLADGIGSSLDTFLRVFDSEGRALRNANGTLVQNDNALGSSDSLLTFTAPTSGIYYIGVSGAGNQTYNAAVDCNASVGSTGNYQLNITVQRQLTPFVSGNRLQLQGAADITLSPGSAIAAQGGLGTTGEPVYVDVNMSQAQVAAALQQSLALFFAGGTTGAYPIRGGDTLELTGLSSFGINAGPFGLTTSFVGDAFGAFNTGTNFDGSTNNARPGALYAQNNAFEGVYLDDFIIGVAGRGEMVLRANTNDTSFIQDPQKAISNPDQFNPEILVGPYQFEIRGGEEYGVPDLDGFPVTIGLIDAVDIDARTSPGYSIRFNAPATYVAGTTFTVGDGTTILTFELDDVNDGQAVAGGNIALAYNTALVDPISGVTRSENAKEIAARFRDLINSPAIRSRLQLSANLRNNDSVGATSDTVALFGDASVSIPPSVGQALQSAGKGGSNRERPQGQIVINAAKVSYAAEFGANIASAPRQTDANNPLLDTQATNPGSPRNTITINAERLAPGAVIMNSEFIGNRAGGINVSGDSQTTGFPSAAVPFVRLVNNTIVGGTVTTVTGFIPTIVDGDVFELGNLAFADAVVSYLPLQSGGPGPIAGLDVAASALGAPNYLGNGEPLPTEGVVSLGRGGQIVLQFTRNLLTGSGDANPDLRIFEVGDSEEVLVEVSADGTRFTSVGRASGASPRIDIDAFGFNVNSRLAFVRLTDISNQGSQTGDSVGADIDAIGALSSVAVDVYTAGGTGIAVSNNGTATILNNVIVNSSVGINVDGTSGTTVIGGSVYQRNSANVGGLASLGQFSTVVGDNVPLFVNAGTGNLYPAPASPLIDSSIDSLEDRSSIVAVKRPLGLAASPILAPQFDIYGQLRVDDPAVETPSGLGENVFKDRGAQDRADFIGPSVVLKNPVDNDLAGLDGNPELSIVELSGVTPRYFDIQLRDGLEPSDPSRGVGIDHSTVNSASVLVYRNNVPLVEGVDYQFGYDSTNGVIRLQPLAGIWRSESVYTVRLLNSKEAAIVTREATLYTDGEQFQVVDATGSSTRFEFDLGYQLSVPSANGVDASLVDGTTFTLDDGSRRLTFEMDFEGFITAGNVRVNLGTSPTVVSAARAIEFAVNNAGLSLTATATADGKVQIQGAAQVAFDPQTSGLGVTGQPGVQTVFGLQIPLEAGQPVGLVDGQTFTIDRSGSPVQFELDTNGVTLPGNVPVRFFEFASAAQVGAALVAAIDGAQLGLSPAYDGDGLVRLGGDSNTRLDLSGTALTQTGIAGQPASVGIALPADATASEVAALIKASVEAAGLTGVTVTQFGNRLVIEGAQGVGGTGAGQVTSIRDLAGNTLKPNQVDGSTTVTIFLGEGLDYGDAPAPYLSTAADNGPRHTVVTGLSLGATVSPDADAKLDNADNDDGLVFTSGVFAAFQSNVSVSVTNTTGSAAFMSLWIDYNGDGNFESAERIFNSRPVSGATSNFSFIVPPSAVIGETVARIRLSSSASAVESSLGAAPDGEVEDHVISIQGNPYTNSAWNLDVNRDGSVSPIDVLQVINWINDPTKPEFLTLSGVTNAPPFIDVNGDGIVSGTDVLQIVNYLNALPPSGEGEMVDGDVSSLAAAASQQTVLASDWAAGLQSMLVNDRKSTRSTQNANDVALLGAFDDGFDDSSLLAIGNSGPATASPQDSFWADLGDDQDDAEQDEDQSWDGQLIIDLLS